MAFKFVYSPILSDQSYYIYTYHFCFLKIIDSLSKIIPTFELSKDYFLFLIMFKVGYKPKNEK